MGKRDKKKSSHRPSASEPSGGGVLTSLRGGFKTVAGASGAAKRPKTGLQRAWDIAFWVLMVALLAFFVYRRLGK